MIRKIFLIIVMCFFCIGCGVKSNPEYKSKNLNIKIIHLV